jgi:hypothetical protein
MHARESMPAPYVQKDLRWNYNIKSHGYLPSSFVLTAEQNTRHQFSRKNSNINLLKPSGFFTYHRV